MPKINVDGKIHTISEGKNLLEAVLSLGYDLPYFCWHPAMGSVGACRQCAVRKFKDEEDNQGKIVMSCMEPASDGSRISIEDEGAHDFRKNVIEWLMTNHPHDCPVCDEGGECHLQDMTVMAGHAYRRFRYKKRTYTNQNLGPCINHEMNRCIQCYRCVRFYDDYAGGKDLQAFSAHNHVYFGRHEDGTLESEFSGNLVEVCPTGVFTDKTLKQHYTRKWDLTSAPSVCQHCSVGCNTLAGERYGSLRRILSRYNGEVNGYFICDRGRFGYEYVNSQKRILHPIDNSDKQWKSIDAKKAIDGVKLSPGKVMGIGSPRASLESNFALLSLVGKEHFYNGISGRENELTQLAIDTLKNGAVKTPSLKEMEECDAVIVIGEDVTNTAPMIDLALKQSIMQQPRKKADKLKIPQWNDAAVRELIQDDRGPLFILTPQQTKLDEQATVTFRNSPDRLAALSNAIAHQLDDQVQLVGEFGNDEKESIETMAEALKNAEKPLIISGTSLQNENIVKSAANLANTLQKANENTCLSFVFTESNSMGVALMEDKSLQDAIAQSKKYDTLIIAENDLYRRGSKNDIDEFLEQFDQVIALDQLENATTEKADLVFPSGTFAESDGTLVNNEGRAQRYFQVQKADEEIRASWEWIKAIDLQKAENTLKEINHFDELTQALEKANENLKGITQTAPDRNYRENGQKVARESHRYSGRTAMHANKHVSEPVQPEDPDSPLTYSMEGIQKPKDPSTITHFWSPGWNSAQAINKFQIEVGEGLHNGDPGIRLIEPNSSSKKYHEINIEAESGNELKAIPIHNIFGSEEMSMQAPAIAKRSKGPFAIVNEKSDLKDGDHIEINIEEEKITLPVKVESHWPEGYIGVSVGFPEIPWFGRNQIVEKKKVKAK